MNSFVPIALHLLALILSCYFICGFKSFYLLFYSIYKVKFLHLLHSSLVGHIFLSSGSNLTNKLLGNLSSSEFVTYYDKALSVIADLLMLVGLISSELSVKSLSSICLLYAFKSFTWILHIKSQKHTNKRMILGSTFILLLALLTHGYFLIKPSLLSKLFCMEYSLLIISILRDQMIMLLNIKEVENNRSLYIFIITLFYLFFKSLVFVVFILQFSKKARFPYGTAKSLLTTINKFYKKMALFKKYLKLVRDLDSMEEVDVEASCAICTDEIIKGKRLKCSHVFHSSCLKMWCEREVSCPICRSELVFRKDEIHETSEEIVSGVPVDVENEIATGGE